MDNETKQESTNSRAAARGVKAKYRSVLHLYYLKGKLKVIYFVASYDFATKKLIYGANF